MKPKIFAKLAGGLLVLLLGAGILVGQEAPEPPEPPQAPAAPEPPEPPAVAEPFKFFLGDGGAWLGVRLRDVNAEKARELKLPGEYGARVVEVEEGSPAAKAGLAKDDVILDFGDQRVWSVASLQRLLQESPPDRTVTLKVSRSGQVRTPSVKLGRGGKEGLRLEGAPAPEIHFPDFDMFSIHPRGARLGISGDSLTRQLAEYFGVKQGKGVLVSEVVVGSSAEKAGLKAGDVIIRVNGTEVGSPADLRRALPRDREEKQKVTLTVVRDRREQTVTVELEPMVSAPLRSAEAMGLSGKDLEELNRATTEIRRQMADYGKEVQKYRGQVDEQTQRLRNQLLPQIQELRQRQLEELKQERRRLRRMAVTDRAA